jgi:ABC-2 type transport system ATP-binding protein
MEASPVIKIEGLVKDYESTRAVDHLDLAIQKGEIFGLLGPNGAGKTTIILALLGLSEPTEGSVSVNNYNATKNPINVKRITGYLPDQVGFSDGRTGLENLVYTALLNGIPRDKAVQSAEELLETVGLKNAKYKKTKTYSRGMIQRLGLADVLIKEPEIIVLDEPTIGIDPKGISDFLKLIRNLSKDNGITVLLSSHLLHQVQKICDRVGILVDGKLLALGNIYDLADKLFGDKENPIAAEVNPITEQLINDLKTVKTITDVQRKDGLIVMKGPKEAVPVISKKIAYNNADLYRLSYKEYGLDDIYKYYFEGSTTDGTKQK